MREKVFLGLLLAIILTLSLDAYAQSNIGIKINGQQVTGDISPIIMNSRTLVPVRLISENLGLKVNWNPEKQEVTLSKGGNNIKFIIGHNSYTRNGESHKMNIAPTIYKGRTFLPLRVIGESLDKNVDWNNETRTVLISDESATNTTAVTNSMAIEKNKSVGFEKAKVVNIIDGDTLVIDRGKGNEKVRLTLVNTPETVHPTKGVEFYGKEASDFTKNQLANKTIYLEKDVSEVDKYGRLLRYVWIDIPKNKDEIGAKCFNAILLLKGYAQVSTFPPDVKYQNEFLKFQREAREKGIGLWGTNPKDTVKSDIKISNDDTSNIPAYIKANGRIIGNKNTKIYHMQSGNSYKKVSLRNAIFFNTEDEAIKAGYRRAKR